MFARRSQLSAVALALLLTLGASVVWGVLAGWCLLLGQQTTQNDQLVEYVLVTQEGQPLIQSYKRSQYSLRHYRDLDGNTVEHSLQAPILQGATLAPLAALGASRFKLLAFNDGREPVVYWYVVDKGNDSLYFEGYDSRSKLSVGYIGAQGFSDELPAASEQIPIDRRLVGRSGIYSVISAAYLTTEQPEYTYGYAGPHRVASWLVFVLSGNRLLEVNLRERSVRTVLTADGMTGVSLIERALPEAGEKDTESIPVLEQNLALRTPTEILIASPRDGTTTSFPLPPDFRDGQLTVHELANDRLLLLAARAAGAGQSEYRLCWLDKQGETKRRETRVQSGSMWDLSPAVVISLCAPSPLFATTAGVVVYPLSLVDSGLEPDFRAAFFHSLREWWPPLAPLFLLSAVLAGLAYRRQRQYAFPAPFLWAALVFLCGPLGYVGYLAHRSWPARRPCPNCDQPAPRDRDCCLECSAPFPSPERKGIEVFA